MKIRERMREKKNEGKKDGIMDERTLGGKELRMNRRKEVKIGGKTDRRWKAMKDGGNSR